MFPKIDNSFDLLVFLKNLALLKDTKDPFWWDNSGSFEVVVGAILVQNTKWESVKISIKNLKSHQLLDVESLANCNLDLLQSLILKCGFFRQKAQRLQNLSKNIMLDFGDFENFKENATQEWLLKQKGLGLESVDSILNYGFYRDVMVVDRYTQRLLGQLGFEFEDYSEIQMWLQNGIIEHFDEVKKLYDGKIDGISLAQVYARFHAKIVEFSKNHKLKAKICD